METKDIIKELRKKHGYTVEQVSVGADIPKSVYPKYESGILNAGVPVLCKLADFYDVSTDYLLGRTPVKQMTTEQPDLLTILAKEFNLSEFDKVIVQAYIAISPEERGKFVKTIEEIVKKGESNQQSTAPSIIQSKPQIQQQCVQLPVVQSRPQRQIQQPVQQPNLQREIPPQKSDIQILKNSEVAVARSRNGAYKPLPTDEQMESFEEVKPGMI